MELKNWYIEDKYGQNNLNREIYNYVADIIFYSIYKMSLYEDYASEMVK